MTILTYGVLVLLVLWTLLQFDSPLPPSALGLRKRQADYQANRDKTPYNALLFRIRRPPDVAHPRPFFSRDDRVHRNQSSSSAQSQLITPQQGATTTSSTTLDLNTTELINISPTTASPPTTPPLPFPIASAVPLIRSSSNHQAPNRANFGETKLHVATRGYSQNCSITGPPPNRTSLHANKQQPFPETCHRAIFYH